MHGPDPAWLPGGVNRGCKGYWTLAPRPASTIVGNAAFLPSPEFPPFGQDAVAVPGIHSKIGPPDANIPGERTGKQRSGTRKVGAMDWLESIISQAGFSVILWLLLFLGLGGSVVAFVLDCRKHRRWMASMEKDIPSAQRSEKPAGPRSLAAIHDESAG